MKAQLRRLQASSLVTAELAEARTRFTEYARDADDLLDRGVTALEATDSLQQQVGELRMVRPRMETEVTGLNVHVT